MENKIISQELLKRAKEAKSPEELQALAAENGIQVTMEQAEKRYAQLQQSSKELADEELDNVAGGGCSFGGCPYCGNKDNVRVGYYSIEYDEYRCKKCGETYYA